MENAIRACAKSLLQHKGHDAEVHLFGREDALIVAEARRAERASGALQGLNDGSADVMHVLYAYYADRRVGRSAQHRRHPQSPNQQEWLRDGPYYGLPTSMRAVEQSKARSWQPLGQEKVILGADCDWHDLVKTPVQALMYRWTPLTVIRAWLHDIIAKLERLEAA